MTSEKWGEFILEKWLVPLWGSQKLTLSAVEGSKVKSQILNPSVLLPERENLSPLEWTLAISLGIYSQAGYRSARHDYYKNVGKISRTPNVLHSKLK
ncbi:hypothetical protein NIES4072_03190 [Nostoc commune NIES-4072]|uniref:Uncharacterized protein n=1 Tax=Nostoc commune NIES-4072 TaxID=2005467 RepID=A0A2R5FK98_NOSCO|nr:hypothetical protein [Nostoc commune]BBD66003.1 hypothetical protein NIES4070_23640 [Nostoc commune HK-02]GBG16673.1 hypothetical protein NIES4072_03190 [Nostoc commune NIES-4072]